MEVCMVSATEIIGIFNEQVCFYMSKLKFPQCKGLYTHDRKENVNSIKKFTDKIGVKKGLIHLISSFCEKIILIAYVHQNVTGRSLYM